MKKLIAVAILFLWFVATTSCAKTNKEITDNIRRVEELVMINTDSALVVLNGIEGRNLRDRENRAKFRLLQTITNDRLGIAHESADDILAARDYFVSEAASDSLLAIVHLYVGRVYESLGRSEEALQSYLTTAPHLDNTPNNFYWKGRVNYHIGELYHYDSDYAHSSRFIGRAIQCFIDCGDTLNAAHAYNLQGFNHRFLKNHALALEMLVNANDLYLAINHIEGLMSNALASSSILLQEPNGAYRADSLMKRVHREYNNGIVPLYHYPMMSRIEEGKRNYAKAIEHLKNYMKSKSDLVLDKQATYNYLIADYYNKLGQHSPAYDYLHEYVSTIDSLYEGKTVTVLQEVEKKYEKQALESEYQAFRKITTLRILIGLTVLVAAIVILVYEVRRRKRKNLDLQADLDMLQLQVGEFDNLKNTLSDVLDKHSEKELRLQEVLVGKMSQVQKIVDLLYLPEHDFDRFKKKIHTAVIEAEKDRYFGELQEVVNIKYAGIVDHLKKRFPSLSEDELNLCCLICFGVNSNQIGFLFGYTNPHSIFNKRHKLREKMGLWPKYDSLEAYLTLLISELRSEAIEKRDNA
jgi:tetratricopeptide (TPR) repeat protein